MFYTDAVLAIAATHNKWGRAHSKLGELEKAVHHDNRALTIYMERFGPGHNGVAKSCNNVGSVHDELGDLEKSKRLLSPCTEHLSEKLQSKSPKTHHYL